MIASYRDKETEKLAAEDRVKKFEGIAKVALRKFALLEAAIDLNDLTIPPANRLEALKGDREGQRSIPINEQYRICFEWKEGQAHNVEVVDYH